MGLKICVKIAVLLLAISPALWLMLQAANFRQKVLAFSFLLISMFGLYCYSTCDAIGTIAFLEDTLVIDPVK